jgi:hypothetical protein
LTATRVDVARRNAPAPSAGLRNAALAAAGVLTLSGRGDLWTLAVAFGVADASALTALVVACVAVATLARSGSAGLADIAGTQAVLGAAGFTGSTFAIAATWASAVGLVLVARDRWTGAALGVLGGLLVAGPSLAGGVGRGATWGLGVVGGAAAGWLAAPSDRRLRWQPWVGLAVAAAGVCFAVVAGYG